MPPSHPLAAPSSKPPGSRAAFLLFALALLGWTTGARANGGGYSFGVRFTGGIAPFQASGTEQVHIEKEHLDVMLRSSDAAVVVRYTMRNHSEQPIFVRFGFPVEAVRENDFDEVGPSEDRRLRKRDSYQQLQDYRVTLDGRPVGSRLELEPFASGQVKSFPGSAALVGIAAWMVSEVTFPPASTAALEIRYSARHFTAGTFVSDDNHPGERTFVYRLSTGAVWGGPISAGTVTLQADGIAADEVEVVAPRGRFVRKGNTWTWTFSGLEPTLADDLTVRVSPRYSEYARYEDDERPHGTYLERGGAWGEGHQRFEARASSTLPAALIVDYAARNVAKEEREAAWCEGVTGDGVGEWLELKPSKPVPLLALRVWPGVASDQNAQLHRLNGSPIRIEVLLNDQHRFEATLGDLVGGELIPVIGYAKPVSRIRLKILAVRPGSSFHDTCIMRVVLYDRLARKPNRYGAR